MSTPTDDRDQARTELAEMMQTELGLDRTSDVAWLVEHQSLVLRALGME